MTGYIGLQSIVNIGWWCSRIGGISGANMYRRGLGVCGGWRVIGANVYWSIIWITWICGRVIWVSFVGSSRWWIIMRWSDWLDSWGKRFPVDCGRRVSPTLNLRLMCTRYVCGITHLDTLGPGSCRDSAQWSRRVMLVTGPRIEGRKLPPPAAVSSRAYA